jgi:hypothetical protein
MDNNPPSLLPLQKAYDDLYKRCDNQEYDIDQLYSSVERLFYKIELLEAELASKKE